MNHILCIAAIALLGSQSLPAQYPGAGSVLDDLSLPSLNSGGVVPSPTSAQQSFQQSASVPYHTDSDDRPAESANSVGAISSVGAAEQKAVRTRSVVFLPEYESQSLNAFDSIQVAPPATAVKPKLLPDNVSFMERGLWGEEGLLRRIGIASPLTLEVRKSELGLRRTMLTLHQIGGFVTFGLMAATDYYGQQVIDHERRSDRNTHQELVTATITSYSLTGLLAVLSPPPLIRRNEISTTTIHKTLAWAHFAGMVLTPILGATINRRSSSYLERAHFHQVSAYVTSALFAASMIVITL